MSLNLDELFGADAPAAAVSVGKSVLWAQARELAHNIQLFSQDGPEEDAAVRLVAQAYNRAVEALHDGGRN